MYLVDDDGLGLARQRVVDGVELVSGRRETAQLGAVDEGQRDGDGVVRLDAEVADHHRARARRLDPHLRQTHRQRPFRLCNERKVTGRGVGSGRGVTRRRW